jgi:hypothetical protein
MSAQREFARVFGAVGLIAVLAGTTLASSTEATSDRLAAAEAELAAAQKAHDQALRSDQISLLADAAAQDAANHSFYQDGAASITCIPGKGMQIGDANGDNTLRVGFYSQFRYVYNIQEEDDTPGAEIDGDNGGFEFRRNRIYLTGMMKGDIKYGILADFGPSGSFTLLDAYAGLDLGDGWMLTAGQFRAPFDREFAIGCTKQQMVELSNTFGLFGVGRTQGIMLGYEAENFDFNIMLNDGRGQANTDWNSDNTEIAFTGRVQAILAGERSQFADYTSNRDSETGFLLGGAFHYQAGADADARLAGSPFDDLFSWTVDGQFEFAGGNVAAAVYGSHIDSATSGVDDTDNYGVMVQGGIYLTEKTELVGRWEYFDFDASSDEPNIFTFGVNHYVDGHANKLQADIGFADDTVPTFLASDRTGLEPDAPGEDGQIFIRLQWQLIF